MTNTIPTIPTHVQLLSEVLAGYKAHRTAPFSPGAWTVYYDSQRLRIRRTWGEHGPELRMWRTVKGADKEWAEWTLVSRYAVHHRAADSKTTMAYLHDEQSKAMFKELELLLAVS